VNTKRKGSRNAHRSRLLLEDLGYQYTRAAASLGTWDIIGIGATDVVLAQVKSNQWPGSGEMQSLRNFLLPANCQKMVHRWRDHCVLPDIKIML
jgi:hypothetical protein